MLSQDISDIIKKLQSSYGEAFFNRLTLQLHQIIGADYTFIARLNEQHTASKTISLVAKGKLADNFEYALNGTPCADVSNDNVCVYQNSICRLFPQDQLLIDMGIEGYVGAPLHDSSGNVMGLVVALFEHAISETSAITSLFSLFSGRIAAEIERNESEAQLRALNQNLEHKVAQRTAELSATLDELRNSQQQIIEHEKLASLGRLVAGVAHEINSPLGIALLSGSTIEQKVLELTSVVNEQTLTRAQLNRLIDDIQTAQQSLQFNMQRAADLVQNFKQVSAEQHSNQSGNIDLASWIATVVGSLTPLMTSHDIEVTCQVPETPIELETYPGQLAQVLTNLLSNIAMHAYPKSQSFAGKVAQLRAYTEADTLYLCVSDRGIGLNPDIINQVCEPFFTTARGKGGTGLGLSIVSNLVRSSLGGTLNITSELGQGMQVQISLPLKLSR
ncbi:HAMP domain-containing histidine kinase [Neiella marina]|uniref:histidine kinase n=1 Tax=Neiella holothuriorum TaxID=2870530 RepID=A0ABS7EC67_9GAMM|nr:HAMP domain-containing sensor histidine kinase [Neiella holothuriorum]MBW8189925.1 HAMP domain-containing histidine kinase [Neiella holothuriorum]